MKLTLILLLLAVPTYGQKQNDICGITTSVWNERERRGTSNYLLTEFKVSVADETIKKSFRHPELPLTINAAVEYVPPITTRNGKPDRVRIAISISRAEEDAFSVVDNAVAGTRYRQNWGGLYVEKQVVIKRMQHTFTLSCHGSGKKKN